MTAQLGVFLVQLVGTVILARLLPPSDFGLVAAATTFSIFLASIGQVGFPEAILQRENIDQKAASNLFWINLASAFALTLAFAASGSLLARVYKDARLSHIAVGISVSIFFTGVPVAHLALLDRAMRFTATSTNNVISRVFSMVLSVVLAWAGFGYWALVAGVVAQPLAATVGAWWLCRWVPSLPSRAEGTGSLFRFALNVNGRWNLNYCTRNLDNFLVGWRFGSGALGFYKKAYDLFVLPANQFFSTFPVGVSTLSRLTRDPAQYRRYFLGGLSVVALVGMGAGGILTLVGSDLVRLILGSAWGFSGRIFTFFGPGIGVMLVYGLTGMLHLSVGTPGRWLRWTVLELAVTAILFVVGLHWGPVGIAAAWTVSFWILIIPGFRYAGRPIGLEVAPVALMTGRYLFASVLAGTGCVLILRLLPALAELQHWTGALIRIATTGVFFVTLYAVAVILVHGGYAPLRQFSGVLREMVSRRKSLSQPFTADVTEECKAVTLSA